MTGAQFARFFRGLVKNDPGTQFSHQRGYRGGAQSPNQSNLRTCVPSRKIFPMSGLRSKSLLNRFSVPLLPKPQLKKRNFMHVRHSPLGRETEGDFYLGRQSRPVIHKGRTQGRI